MNKLKIIRRCLAAFIMCLSLLQCGCGSDDKTESSEISSVESRQSDTISGEQVIIDYGDAESFEAALNEGDKLEGKVVRFVVGELHPDSKLGYNVWAGEHLNFVSSGDPDMQAGDTVVVRITNVDKMVGSWIINYEKVDNAVENDNTIIYSKSNKTTTAKKSTKEETSRESDTPDDSAEEINYENNKYYDIIETACFQNSIGRTIIIHKVIAKQSVSLSADLLAYSADGSVIGKSSDRITLTEGQHNFFRYVFEDDISEATLKANINKNKDSLFAGESNAVEMVQYDISDRYLYITFKQNVDELSGFEKYKILFYKGDQIVDSEEGMFSTRLKNLNGKDSTDVAKIMAHSKDYDRIEYIFEP